MLGRLPFDLQSFYEIRTKHMAYADKTDLMWKLVHSGKYYFLSRPRRFGKSLLLDTMRCYFEGRRELFEGLKIMDYETEWVQYPVIRFDMSGMDGTAAIFFSRLDNMLSDYEKIYNLTPTNRQDIGSRFKEIIMEAKAQTGHEVVVLIDEYDRPLQQSWGTDEHEQCKNLYRSLLEMLKPLGDQLRFVFLTGITKFTQLSLFSSINNLHNISFDGDYAAICGVSADEIHTYFEPYVQRLADEYGISLDGAYQLLKENYDGYHFSRKNMVDVYNPFSLVNALEKREITSYWASSGATTLLQKFVPDLDIHIGDYDHDYPIDRVMMETSDVGNADPALFLYQSGYLTIKSSTDRSYLLGYPNQEVREAMCKMVLPAMTLQRINQYRSHQLRMADALDIGQVDVAFRYLQALVADIPYGNKRLNVMGMEERYRLLIATLLRAVGFVTETEHMQAGGRPDVVLYAKNYIYVIELKLEGNGGVEAAAEQIRDRRYIDPYLADGRPVIALAIAMNDEGKGLTEYKIVD